MAKLPKLSGKEVAKIVAKLGFEYSHTTGSHMVYKHPDGRKTTIPYHSGEDLGPGLFNKIIKKDLQMTRKEFLSIINQVGIEVVQDLLEREEELLPQQESVYVSEMQDKLWKLMGREEYT